MKKYKVYDSFGHIIRAFNTWGEANCFRIVMNRPDWEIR